MKIITSSMFFALCLAATFIFGGATLSKAQPLTAKSSKTLKSILSDIARSKTRGERLVLLTPKDLAALSSTERTGLTAGGDPCETAVQISIGQTIGNALNGTDCRLEDGSYADFYTFNANQGQQVTLTMSSSSIDSYLGLANESGTFTVEDDDSGGGLTARIAVTLPETGLYVILANSALPNEFGGYTLVLGPAQPCVFSLSANSASIPATGGTFTLTVNTQPQCQWQAISISSFITTNSSGTGTGTITYTVLQNGSGQIRSGSIRVGSAPLLGIQEDFTITQPSVSCTYSLNPASVNIPATQTTGTFSIVAPAGCPWSVQTGGFASASGSGTGNGTITYTAGHNNGAARIQTITVGGQIFTINQAGLDCVFTVSPRQINVTRRENTGTISVNAQPGCIWSAMESSTFLDIQSASGTGAGSFTYRIEAQTENQARSAAISVNYGIGSTLVFIDQSKNLSKADFDYDTDSQADLSVFRPSNGTWYIHYSTSSSFAAQSFGSENDLIAPADYDGDGRTDIAVFRPSNGTWYWINSSTGTFSAVQFGTTGDVPVPSDYQGDLRADIAVFRPSNGIWYRLNNLNNQVSGVQFGSADDKPIIGDFDGDGKSDISVWRPGSGAWYRLNSSNNSFVAVNFGTDDDVPVSADYDGDGKSDVAVFRPSNATWYLNRSTAGLTAIQFGTPTDAPVPADYDGDGRADVSVFRPSNGIWYLQRSTAGFTGIQFGSGNDQPVPSAFIP